jgi:dolichol-phosphate mannosyltransferase
VNWPPDGYILARSSLPRPESSPISRPPSLASDLALAVELTVVAPAFNEVENMAPLVSRVQRALVGVAWQLIIVDDNSPDGTADTAKALAMADPRIVCLRRVGRRGLAGAVIEGALASAAPYIAVIDADLQHDETLLGTMLDALRTDRCDLVIGSRYIGSGSAEAGFSGVRAAGSRLATWLARLVLKAEVSDPVSGFFMIRRSAIDRVVSKLSSQGFKILFDIIASQPEPLRIVELPYQFAEREAGESKLDKRVVVEYLGLILSRLSGNVVPPRALLFFLVGASGLVVNLAALKLGIGLRLDFAAAQAIAAITAMTSNYLINNQVTYRDRRLRGLRLITGYFRFFALCSVGLIANVAVADLVNQYLPVWWIAGIAGAIFGAVWNYVSTSLAVW